jgi:FecR protein
MRGWRRPVLAWLALAVYLAPAPALAQATKAGVVTTLEGNVTAVRAVAPQPVALKFKDDVFLQDRVVTGEQSFARLLLGGKAVVSIRERSAVTITEIPGRSTIDVESGKIALSVARDRMQPGEVINIKMPNAVAGVRGTVVIAEVSYAMVGGAQQAMSNLAVLRGQVEVVHTNAAGAAIGAPVMVGALQKFSATPTSASTGTFTVEQIGGIVQGLQSKGAADPGTASQGPARLEAVNTAVALLTALTGTSGSQTVQHLATGTPRDILTSPDVIKPPQRVTAVADAVPAPTVPGTGGDLSELVSSLQPLPPAPVNMATLPSGQSLLTFTGNEVQSSDGTPITPTTAPLVSSTGFTISQQGADDLVVAKSDANIVLPGPLLKLTDTSVQAGDAFLSVAGRVTSTSPQPFINLDPTMVTAPGNLVEVVGPSGVLGLAGALVQDTGGTISVGGSVVAVSEGGTLTGTGSGALVQLNGTTVTASSLLSVVGANLALHGSLVSSLDAALTATDVNRAAVAVTDGAVLSTIGTAAPLFSFAGTVFNGSSQVTTARNLLALSAATEQPAPSMSLSGPLMAATNTTIRVGDPTVNPFSLIFVGDSATYTSTTSSPALSFVSSILDLSGNVFSGRRSTSAAAPTTITLSGPLISATDSSITTTTKGFDTFFGTTGQACCGVVSVNQGAKLTTTADLPLVQAVNSTLNAGPDSRSGGSFFSVTDTFGGAPVGELVAPSTVNLAGQLLTATNSNVSALFHLLNISNSTLTSTTTSALVSLSGGSLVLGGPNPVAANAVTFARGLSLSGAGAVLSLHGPLFAFSNMNATSTGEMLGVFNSSLLTDTTAQALLQLSGGNFTAGPTANFMSIASSAGLSPSMQLAGPLLSTTNAMLKNGDQTGAQSPHAFTFIGDSAQVSNTSMQPLFDFRGTSVEAAGSILTLRRSLTTATPTRLTLAGPLARFADGSTIDVTSLSLGSACCSLVDVDQAAQLISSTATALIQVSSSVINNGPDVQSGGTLFFVADAAGVSDGPITASPALVSLRGPLISSENSSISSLFHLVGVTRSTLSSTSTEALIQLTGSRGNLALQLGGIDPFVTSGNQTRTGRVLSVLSSAANATAGDAALVSLAGPLLSAVSAPIQLTGDMIGVFNGAKVDSTSTKPFVLLSGETTALVAGAIDPVSSTVIDGRLLVVAGTGGPDGITPASLTISGPLLRQEGGSIVDTNSRGLTLLTDGALVTRAPPIETFYPLLQVDASSLSVGGTSRTGVLFEVTGGGALANDPQTNPITGGPSSLQFGQQRPLQHNGLGALLEASNGAFVNIRGANGTVLRLDTALLDATAPIFLLTTSARLQTSGNGIDLIKNARLQASNANDAVVRIDSQARMDVLNGHLASVSASRLNVAGDLVRMGSNSLLNVTNGVLLSVLNGGIANINGALVSFTGIGGTINITNTLAPTAFIAGIPVNVAPGGNIAIGQGALANLNVNNNTIRINNVALPTNATATSGITGSLISVGANGTVRVGGGLN